MKRTKRLPSRGFRHADVVTLDEVASRASDTMPSVDVAPRHLDHPAPEIAVEVAVEVAADVVPETPESPVDEAASPVDDLLLEPDEDHSAYWAVWAGPIARAVQPVLDDLRESLPGLTSALAFTPAGVTICSTGLDPADADRLSSVAGSSYSLGGVAASRASAIPEDQGHADSLYLAYDSSQAVIVAIKDLIVGPLLLWVAAEGTNLGVLTFQAKGGAERIRTFLASEDAGPA